MNPRYLNLGITLALCFGFASCNTQDEYFEKAHLSAVPGSTDGRVVDGGEDGEGGLENSHGGGLNSGVDGGSIGGSTSGSSSGSSDGSTSGGSTAGSSDGSVSDGTDEYQTVTEVFQQADEETKKLDILWVVDNSGSMSDEQSSLGANFSSFIDNFIYKDVDFKMAVTTTDVSTTYKKGLMVSGSDLKLTSAKAKEDPIQFKSDFRKLVNVGTRGHGTESGLAATEGFMEKYAHSFVRPEAYLAVVVISDEEDQSSKTVKQYADYLKTFKISEGLVKFYSVVDVNNRNCCSKGIATGGERYKQASNLTAGLIANIRDDFHNVLTAMGDSIINLLDSFALASEPVAGSLKVYVNGALTNDYTYDSATHSIKFHENYLPPVGAEIKVTYLK